jgi:DNA (cytosine-5)-methyltransferase 1
VAKSIKMKHGSLFSGIGGFDLAAQWMGWDNVFHCEINSFGRKVLKYYWPKAISYEDITKTDFTIHRGKIDILTGGFPCQPYSTAGKRLGKEDDRHLWPEMLRAIREIQPRWIVGENVRGLVSWNGGMVFEEVQADLEDEGYEVQPFILPACAVNAPHRRDRVWFIAYTKCSRRECWTTKPERYKDKKRAVCKDKQNDGIGVWSKVTRRNSLYARGGITPNASKQQLQGSEQQRSTTEAGATKGQSRQFSRSVCSQWQEFPTQPPVCSRNDGISTKLDGITFSKWRNESIKAYGNAVVPQLVHQIFKAIEEHDKQRFQRIHREETRLQRRPKCKPVD